MAKFEVMLQFQVSRVDTFLFMVGQITGKMFDHPIEKDCVQIYPIRQVAGPDRSEAQSFSIIWSNILPVIWPTINKKVSTLADLKLQYDLKFGHWLPLS